MSGQTQTERLVLQIHPKDNVAVAVKPLKKGTVLPGGVRLLEDLPQAHKAAMQTIAAGAPVIRYGVVLGHAVKEIPQGSWVREDMLHVADCPSLEGLTWGTHLVPAEELPEPPVRTWMGYRNAAGPAGTRNYLGIVTTVQCAAGVVRSVTERIRRELLPKYPNVEGVVAITHAYGCGVAIRAREAGIPIRAIRNIIQHPNFGGEAIVVGLGCEKLTYDMVLPPEKINAETCITLQEQPGHAAMEQAILDLAEKKLRILNERRREELPLSELCIGMQCGGSDAFSGISANPAAGCAADMLVRGGATVLFSEITEVRDGVQLLAARCRDEETCRKLAREMDWYDHYLAEGGVDRDANPTPGNAGQQEGRPCQHRGKGDGLHCEVRLQPDRGGPLSGGAAAPARPDLCRDARQRHRLRPVTGGQRHRPSGVHDRTRHALRAGNLPGHQGLQPERAEGAVAGYDRPERRRHPDRRADHRTGRRGAFPVDP